MTYCVGYNGCNFVWQTWLSDQVATNIGISYEWSAWNMESTGSAITTCSAITNCSSIVWPGWNEEYCVSHATSQEVADQLALDAVDQERINEANKRRIEEQAVAKSRAEALLVSNLDVEQAESFRKSRLFVVHSRDKKRRYRIEHGMAGNVKLLSPDGRVVASFCIHPLERGIPAEDVMLAQKLMLEAAEEEFLRIANKTLIAAA